MAGLAKQYTAYIASCMCMLDHVLDHVFASHAHDHTPFSPMRGRKSGVGGDEKLKINFMWPNNI